MPRRALSGGLGSVADSEEEDAADGDADAMSPVPPRPPSPPAAVEEEEEEEQEIPDHIKCPISGEVLGGPH
jgi:hypothetical protein